MKNLKALAKNYSEYEFSNPDAVLLEKFPSPFEKHIHGSVHIEAPEFTSLCPMTGQPDFAKIIIDYVPDKSCVESKSLKLYLMGFRNYGEFHESCVYRICMDLATLLDPWELTVKGEFTPRGGIPFWPTATYKRED